MPYIKPERRIQLDPATDNLIWELRGMQAVKGDLNYIVTFGTRRT